MIENKIYVRFIGRDGRIKVIEECINGINHVEQLVFRILDKEGVGPVCRCLFGLRLVNEHIWLAPNIELKSIHRWSYEGSSEPKLELRMRFRPACFKRLFHLDQVALDIIFSQIRYDFTRTRFSKQRRYLILPDNAVLGLVVLDLIRHSLEHNIDIDIILDKVNRKDFLPSQASRWQRAIVFDIDRYINLREELRVSYEQCDKCIYTIKRKYIELFLERVADKYAAETYVVRQLIYPSSIDDVDTSIVRAVKLKIRVQYMLDEEITSCVVETVNIENHADKSDKKKQLVDDWIQVCDIKTLNHATLRHNIVQLTRGRDNPVRYQFETRWHAESFLSILDGYYRLMKKWNRNLFRDIWSPSLLFLKQLESHGPIGFETARRKLASFERPGDFIVRQCMEVNNRYLVDTILLSTDIRLTIDIDWFPDDGKFRQTGFSVNKEGFKISIETSRSEYLKIRHLIRDIEIRASYKSKPPFTKQLKHWIQPEDDDDYPALLLSLSQREIEQLDHEPQFYLNGSMIHLPRLVPSQLLKYTGKHLSDSKNGIRVDLAIMDNARKVVVKDFSLISYNHRQKDGLVTNISDDIAHIEQFAFHVCPDGHASKSNKIEQVWITDLAFVNSHLLVETVGFILSGALIQEYLFEGSLDVYLKSNIALSSTIKSSIAFQLVQALLFLNQRRIIHGKIRCHNVMIKQLQPIQVKLADPLGSFNVESDKAFIPAEYFCSNIGTCVKKFYSGIDVWALGTTLWQIYNDGTRPPHGSYASNLPRPINCSDDIWQSIEKCWIADPNFRATPSSLFGNFCDFLAWEKGAHNYFYILPEDTSTNDLSNSTQNTVNSFSQSKPSNDESLISDQSMISTCGTNGSRSNLMKISPNGVDTISTSSGGSGTTTTSRSDARMISSQISTTTKVTTWRNIMKLGRNLRYPTNLPPRNDFEELFGSRSSLSNCVTPSGSDVTRLTTLDLENLSDAFDRCVWHIDVSKLRLGPEIGRGSSGVVRKGTLYQIDGDKGEQVVAVKCVDRDCFSPNENQIDDMQREFNILKNLDHENIVKMIGYIDDNQMMLIFEYMPLGSLLSSVKSFTNPDELHKLPLRKYALDIAHGMSYLESRKIVHRDLALRNILLSDRNTVKICDFGLAISLGTEDYYKLETERALPLKWYAPESISSQIFTHKSDVWSYGVVLWEVYSCGDSPQYSGTYANLSETLKHERLAIPKKCPTDMYDLMLDCWAYSPDDRTTFSLIVNHLTNLSPEDQ